MKYIGMPMGMWALFGKSFERNLVTEFGLDRDTAKTVAVKAKLRYKGIIAGLPEFEKEDRFKMNIVNCALPCCLCAEYAGASPCQAADSVLCRLHDDSCHEVVLPSEREIQVF